MSATQQTLDEKLFQAVTERNLNEVTALIAAGANVNAQRIHEHLRGLSTRTCKRPVLHFAFGHSWDEESALPVVKALLDAGADVDARDEFNANWTALMRAAFMECPRLVKLLIDKGANTTLKDEQGRTVFGLVLDRNDAKYHDVLVVLTEATAEGKAWLQSPEGRSWRRAWEVDDTAPIPCKPADAYDVLRNALAADDSKAHQQVIRWVESGGNLDWCTGNGWTLLHLAAQCGNEKMVRFLIERGANIEARDKEGETPLMLACETGYSAPNMNPGVVSAFLELGADANAEGRDGRTALRLVRLLEVPEAKQITALLEQHGAKKVPGKTATCPECGAPESVRMRDRGVRVTFNGVFAGFSCPDCRAEEEVPLDAIDKVRGIQVSCPSCRRAAFVPPTVWCKTCGIGLSTGWQSRIVSGTEAIEAA